MHWSFSASLIEATSIRGAVMERRWCGAIVAEPTAETTPAAGMGLSHWHARTGCTAAPRRRAGNAAKRPTAAAIANGEREASSVETRGAEGNLVLDWARDVVGRCK